MPSGSVRVPGLAAAGCLALAAAGLLAGAPLAAAGAGCPASVTITAGATSLVLDPADPHVHLDDCVTFSNQTSGPVDVKVGSTTTGWDETIPTGETADYPAVRRGHHPVLATELALQGRGHVTVTAPAPSSSTAPPPPATSSAPTGTSSSAPARTSSAAAPPPSITESGITHPVGTTSTHAVVASSVSYVPPPYSAPAVVPTYGAPTSSRSRTRSPRPHRIVGVGTPIPPRPIPSRTVRSAPAASATSDTGGNIARAFAALLIAAMLLIFVRRQVVDSRRRGVRGRP